MQKSSHRRQCATRGRLAQYLVWAPRAATTVRHLLGQERISRWILSCGMALHSSCSATASCWSVCGCRWRCRTRRSRVSHRCSIGLRSGDLEGHGKTLTLEFCRKVIVARAVWGRALSCWNICLCWSIIGRRWGRNTWSMYRWAVRFPWMITKCDFWLYEMAPQTITLPPPNLSTCRIQLGSKRSWRRLYTRCLPSWRSKRKRDSSENQMRLHCCKPHILTLRHHLSRWRRCWGRSKGLTTDLQARKPASFRRFLIVWADTLLKPGTCVAVTVGMACRLRRWWTRMYLSWAGAVILGLPLLWRSFLELVLL